MNNRNSLEKVIGKTKVARLYGTVPANTLDQAGEDYPVKRISIKREQMSAPSLSDQFEDIVQKISIVLNRYPDLVIDALIKTGSPVEVSNYSDKRLNKEVQNRLVSQSTNGRKFRTLMTHLLAKKMGESFKNDSFFRKDPELKVGVSGGTPVWSDEAGSWVFDENPNTINTEEVKSDPNINNGQSNPSGNNWGEILQGSASLVDSIGGVIGMFQGGNQGTENDNVFNPYTPENGYSNNPTPRKKRNTGLIVGLIVGAVILGGLIYFLVKKND